MSATTPPTLADRVDSIAGQQDIDKMLKTELPPTSTGLRKYHMYYTTSRFNARLHPVSKAHPAAYYFETNTSHTTPQFLLRRGDSKTSPMVNFARLKTSTRHILVGKGDFRNQPEGELFYEELRRDKNLMHRSDYQFGTAEGDADGRRADFGWRKNREMRGKTVYECLDEKGLVAATFASGGVFNWKKGAEIEVRKGLEQGLEEFLLMTALAIWAMEGRDFHSLFSGFK